MTTRAKPRSFTTGEVKEVIRLYHEGKTQAETGKILGRHSGVISHVWKDNGLSRRVKFTAEKLAKIKYMDSKGYSCTRMSVELGVSENTVRRKCEKLGITRKNKTGEKK